MLRMKKIIIITGVVVAVALMSGGFFMWWARETSAPAPSVYPSGGATLNADDAQQAWVEVSADHVSRISLGSSSSTEIFSGDRVVAGDTIVTDDTGTAVIHFPDGSLARIDTKSRVAIDESRFAPESGDLRVRLSLFAGNVWSKIIQLATPDSQWQVQTSNTVATVRGTAFGVSYANGTSRIIGSEHVVSITVIDPVSHKAVEDQSASVDAGETITVDDAVAQKVAQKRIRIDAAIATTSAAVLQQSWVRGARNADAVIDATIAQWRDQHLDMPQIRQKLHEQSVRLREEKLRQRGILPAPAAPSPSSSPSSSQTTSVQTSVSSDVATKTVAANVTRVDVKASSASSTVVNEGDQIVFSAVAIMSDGTKKDVTRAAQWRVVGDIGTMISPGVFVARLGATAAEYGKGVGSIVAVFEDSTSGQLIVGKSDLYTVQATITPVLNPLQG
jgi:hypothetical protein